MNNSNFSIDSITRAFSKFGNKDNTIGLSKYNEDLIELVMSDPIYITEVFQEGENITFDFYQKFGLGDDVEVEYYVCTLDADQIRSSV